jgi:hypothetical protein
MMDWSFMVPKASVDLRAARNMEINSFDALREQITAALPN